MFTNFFDLRNFNSNESSFSNDSLQTDLELIKRALDASHSGIVITDNLQPDNPIIYCNEAFQRLSGYNQAQIIGHNCRFLQAKDRSQEAREVLRTAVRDGKSCTVEIRNYREDGSLFWNELYVSAVKNSADQVTHFIGVQNDISKRKNAEKDLIQHQLTMEKKIVDRTQLIKESEEYLNSIVQTVRECLIVLDKDIQVLSVNAHFLKTFKVSLNETEGRHLYELGNGQWDIPLLREMIEKVLPTNNPIEDFVVEHDFPHIGKKFMLVNAYRIELEGSFRDRILLAIEDVTERTEIERRKDDFLSIASHELKTPLTTVKGYVQMIKRMVPENSTDKFKNIVSKTELYVDRLNNLISELLDVSKIQTGNLELHKEVFDFDKMVYDTVDGMKMAHQDSEIKVEGFTNAMLNADESHVIQVISNLISNGLKYAPANNKIIVYISLVSKFIKVSVIDYGIGISLDDQKRIFDRFFRVTEVQKEFPGMGVGLYVCAEIVKKHGGTIWVESEKGKGSNFSFTLPLDN